MSYDLYIWSVSAGTTAHAVLGEIGFVEQAGNSHSLEGKGWQIVASVCQIKDEDIPDAATALLAGINSSIHLSLEPGSAPPVAYAKLRKIARQLAKLTTGVIENGQDETYELASGARKYLKPKRESRSRFSILVMSWWFEGDLLEPPEKLRSFVQLLGRYLPEAIPRRYGSYEPPEFTYADTRTEHFVEFLRQHTSGIVWYTTKPVWGVNLNLSPKSGFVNHAGKRRFKCSYFSVSLDAEALEQKGWERHLQKTWRELSQILRPFYGDVRILKNYLSGKNTYFSDSSTQHHPVKSWWWRGVPSRPALARVVGPPYICLWSDLTAFGKPEKGLYFASALKWSEQHTDETQLAVPGAIAQPANPELRKPIAWADMLRFRAKKAISTLAHYPEHFPFIDNEPEVTDETVDR